MKGKPSSTAGASGDHSGPVQASRPPKRRRRLGRIVAIAAGGLVAALVAALIVIFAVSHLSQPAQPGSFYAPPSSLPNKPPGSVIRSEPLTGLPSWARGWRILYISTSYTGKPTAVSGVVLAPSRGSSRPRNVVAFANGTVGVASKCARSIGGARSVEPALEGLRSFISAGDDAVMTDYQGLGTPGPHPYLVGRVEGEDVLDAVRAAHNLKPAYGGTAFAVTGYSQGGHAALFAGQLVPTYAPELKLVGIAASAPPTDLKELFRIKGEGLYGRILAAYGLDSWSRVYGHDLETTFTPHAHSIVRQMVRLCIHNTAQALGLLPLTAILHVGYLKRLPWQTEPWKSILQQNSPGQTRIPAPLFIAQGADDQLVHPPVTAAFVRHLCRMGERVQYRLYRTIGHEVNDDSAPDVVKWIAARFADKPPPSICPRPR